MTWQPRSPWAPVRSAAEYQGNDRRSAAPPRRRRNCGSAELPQYRKRRLPQGRTRPEPSGNRHGDRAAADTIEPQRRIAGERNVEYAIGEYVADRRCACRGDETRDRAEQQKFGDLRATQFSLRSTERAEHGGVVSALVLC